MTETTEELTEPHNNKKITEKNHESICIREILHMKMVVDHDVVEGAPAAGKMGKPEFRKGFGKNKKLKNFKTSKTSRRQ